MPAEINSKSGSSTSESASKLLNEKSWLDYLWIIRDHWILALVVGCTLAGFYIHKESKAVPLYRSTALLLFELQQERVINIQQVVDNSSIGRSANYIMRNHLTDLRSNSFRGRIVDSLSPEELDLITRDYRSGDADDSVNPHAVIADSNKIALVGGNVFKFEFHHRNPQAAALLANRFSEEFNDFLLERSRKTNESALRFLRSQSEELKLKVERSEMAVQQYRQERNLVSLEESQNLIVDRMKNLSGTLNDAKIELINLKSTLERIEANDGDLDTLAKLPALNQMGTLPGKFETRTSLLAARDTLSLRYGRRHPRMIENATAIERIEADIKTSLQKNISDFNQETEAAERRVSNLESALADAEKEALELDQIAIEYNVLRRKLDTDKRLFTQVHQRLNEAILASQLNNTNLRVVDRAWAAASPFTPDTAKVYSMAVFIFFGAFGAIPYAIHFLNLKLKTATEIENQLQVPFLGEIRKFPRKLKKLHLLVLEQTDPQAAELFRQIHSQILLKNTRLEKGHTFIVTSALPKEGKSFFAINLSASFSRHHYRTLLMDCDFRRPTIGERMKEELIEHGWKEEEEPLEPVTMAKDFDVLTATRSTVEATEWIESKEFRDLLQKMRQEYDIIIIDTPPAGLFPDAGLIGNYAEQFLFITQLNKHRKAALKAMMNRLQQSKADILGIIVNKTSRSKSRNLGVYKYADYSKYKNYYPQKAKS
jgi:succinoglycan biosynthesis transport protein ExoP